MSEWHQRNLGDLIHVKHGYAFKGEFFADEGEKLVLKPGNFPIGGGITLRPGKDAYYTGDYPPDFELTAGDLLVVMTDLTQAAPILGSPAFVPAEPVMLHNQRLGLVQVKPGVEVDRRFLYYAMLSDTSRSQIRATATGATVRHTAPERIYRVKLGMPDLPTQRVIGDVLGSIDDLIANNRRRVAVLEEMARAIYREWFVKFRYPGHEDVPLIDSALGPIPEGWDVAPTSKAIAVNPRVKLDKSIDHPFMTMGDLDERAMSCRPSQVRKGGSGAKFEQGDTLFARITPCLENGKTGLVQTLADGEIGLGSTEFIVLRGQAVGSAFTYCLAREEDFRKHAVVSMSGASGRQRVRNECFDTYLLAVPTGDVADAFEVRMEPLFAHVAVLTDEASALGQLRDLLLPKLVTGQIDASTLDLGGLVSAGSAAGVGVA